MNTDVLNSSPAVIWQDQKKNCSNKLEIIKLDERKASLFKMLAEDINGFTDS